MKLTLKNDFWLVNGISLLLILLISFFPITALRVILGVPFLLFLPGYAWLAAFFPRKTQLSGVERTTYSLGFSVVLVIIAGLVLNITPWGIRLYPVLVALSVLTLAGSSLGWYRRRRLGESDRYQPSLSINFSWWHNAQIVDRALYILLAVAILGAAGFIGYRFANPVISERFTEFYILGATGKTELYLTEAQAGKPAQVTVGIINHEQAVTTYRIEVRIDGIKNSEAGPITLEDGEKWQQPITFIPVTAGNNRKVELFLYRGSDTEPYLQPLRLRVDVAGRP